MFIVILIENKAKHYSAGTQNEIIPYIIYIYMLLSIAFDFSSQHKIRNYQKENP